MLPVEFTDHAVDIEVNESFGKFMTDEEADRIIRDKRSTNNQLKQVIAKIRNDRRSVAMNKKNRPKQDKFSLQRNLHCHLSGGRSFAPDRKKR